MKFICFEDPKSSRSHRIAKSMAKGVDALGHESLIAAWADQPVGDVAIGYGWAFPEVLKRYPKFVHVDLGWWGRKPPHDPTGGYHKVAVNARDPDEYFRRGFPRDRFAKFMLSVRPWRESGNHILLAGTSEKSAKTRGYGPHEWELAAIGMIRRRTDRPIVYRPKPSWIGATPIRNTVFSPPHQALEDVLENCWAIVTLHSNVAVDGLVAGVPAFGFEGIAKAVSSGGINELEVPTPPQDRIEMLADLAWCQWTPDEMASGACLKHLLEHTPLRPA